MSICELLKEKINGKTKPVGSLGVLEQIALQIGKIQNTLQPKLSLPTIVVFAADHGIAEENVSAYPQKVTHQMVMNFLNGGAAINVFSNLYGIHLKIVDAGVNYTFSYPSSLINAKIGYGTNNFLYQKAMNDTQLEQCFEKGRAIVDELKNEGCNIIGFGEMGIGNTSAASLLMSCLCELPIESCVGRGTGLSDEQLERKITVLKKAQYFHGFPKDIHEVLKTFGGFEMVQMCGAMLAAFEHNMLLLVDGFIASTVFLAAKHYRHAISQNAIFCHLSDEKGHRVLLDYLNARPLLNFSLRLGEGTGCALAYPIIQAAVAFLNDMATFESAGVSQQTD